MSRQCDVLRVFTRGEAGGNHLGVVSDRSGLDTDTMQAVAADLGFSETVFLEWRDDLATVRIFTPGAELPFAGHPLVGMTWMLNEGDPGSVNHIECGIGIVQIGVDGAGPWVSAPFNQKVRQGVDLDAYDPGSEPLAVTVVEMPIPYYVVELGDTAAVAEANPASDGMVYVFARTGSDSVRARFFAGGVGIVEDPATGSAAVALAATMRVEGVAEGAVTISQGEEIGFPSTINLSWTDASARIGGTVVRDEVRWLDV